MRLALPAVLLCALWLAGCDRRAATVAFDPGPVPPEHAAGAEVFEASCVRCHGAHAAGTDLGPPLVHPYYEPNHHADAAFYRAVQFGVQPHHWSYGPMPAVEGLGRAQVEQVIGYVRWLQRQAGIY